MRLRNSLVRRRVFANIQSDEELAMKEWYYINNGEEVGPIALEELQKLATCGTLGLESPVREQGRKWMTAVAAVAQQVMHD